MLLAHLENLCIPYAFELMPDIGYWLLLMGTYTIKSFKFHASMS